jgi:DNA-3-methyladenine glycosylase II
MPNIASQKTLAIATKYLIGVDQIMASVIAQYGQCNIAPHSNYYQQLINSIIGQQLSVKAASSIRTRFYALFGGVKLPSPEDILSKSVEELRNAGLSNAKAKYVHDLALHVLEGRLNFDDINSLSNDEVVKMLTDVKGIGDWTAHMFLMFGMGRLDVLPVGDLGIKNGVMKLYSLKTAPTPDQITQIALKNNWHPYETVASWYIWQSLDNEPKN